METLVLIIFIAAALLFVFFTPGKYRPRVSK